MKTLVSFIVLVPLLSVLPTQAKDWAEFPGGQGPGQGKRIVFLTGDEEYRSEEGLPQLAKILSTRHGFQSMVLFSVTGGFIDPNNRENIPGIEKLAEADLVVMLLRFRELPDDKMRCFVDYLNAGKPIIALRTSTHAFSYEKNKKSQYAKFSWQSRDWPGGFGQQVLGDTWVNHHGDHGKESTRGLINPAFKNHPILRGVTQLWGPTDVYGLAHLPGDVQVLVHGQVLAGMTPNDPPVAGKKNDPMMPIVWTRDYRNQAGTTNKIVTTTMGASTDLLNQDLRRLLVNACYWTLGLADRIPLTSNVDLVGDYKPTPFGSDKYTRNIKPSDHELK